LISLSLVRSRDSKTVCTPKTASHQFYQKL
jgi:hypothetical protein